MLTSTFDTRAKNNLHMRYNPVHKFRPVEHMTFAFNFESRDYFLGFLDYLHKGKAKKATSLPRPSFFLRYFLHTEPPQGFPTRQSLGFLDPVVKMRPGRQANSWQDRESQGRENGTIPVPLKEAEEKAAMASGVSVADEL